MSSTPRVIGPILSHDQQSAMQPSRGTRPKVGRRPVVPQRVHGDTIEPSVSVPIANGTHPAATADALPALEPDEPCSMFHGLRQVPPNQMSPYASAPTAVFATSTAPASRSRSTTTASPVGTRSRHGSAPQVVRIPFVSKRSLRP